MLEKQKRSFKAEYFVKIDKAHIQYKIPTIYLDKAYGFYKKYLSASILIWVTLHTEDCLLHYTNQMTPGKKELNQNER